jgi:hypothetical protein
MKRESKGHQYQIPFFNRFLALIGVKTVTVDPSSATGTPIFSF